MLPHSEFKPPQDKEKMTTSEINFVVNNILLKQINALKEADDDFKQKMMISCAEILYGQEGMISTKRLARLLLYLMLMVKV